MFFALSLYSFYNVSYPSTHTHTNTHTHTHTTSPFPLVSFSISQMWGKRRRSQGGVCVPQGPLFLLNCRETPHVQKTPAHTYTHTNKVNNFAQLVHPCSECSNLCLANLLEFCHAVANFQTGLEKWLCFVCHVKCVVWTCVYAANISHSWPFHHCTCFIVYAWTWQMDIIFFFLFFSRYFSALFSKPCINNTDKHSSEHCQQAASLIVVTVVHQWIMDFLLKEEC